MVVETGFRIVGVFVHQQDLFRHVVEDLALGKDLAVLRVERRAHEQPVEPHLVGIALLVPEAALAGPRLLRELTPEELDGLFQPLVAGLLVVA